MAQLEALVQELKRTGKEVFWQGKASPESIQRLEGLLSTRLPNSFRHFLSEYGGGGLVGEEISGIEDDDATLDYRGTVLGDTLRCRSDFALPSRLIVIYLGADDVVWCLDTSVPPGTECPIVSYNVHSKTIKRLAETFDDFFAEYVRSRIARA
jgi:hypothetical protein